MQRNQAQSPPRARLMAARYRNQDKSLQRCSVIRLVACIRSVVQVLAEGARHAFEAESWRPDPRVRNWESVRFQSPRRFFLSALARSGAPRTLRAVPASQIGDVAGMPLSRRWFHARRAFGTARIRLRATCFSCDYELQLNLHQLLAIPARLFSFYQGRRLLHSTDQTTKRSNDQSKQRSQLQPIFTFV
jgi:hypothetical protein